MLCNTCLRQDQCLTHRLALRDQALQTLLQGLQQCDRRIVSPTQDNRILKILSRAITRLFFTAKQTK